MTFLQEQMLYLVTALVGVISPNFRMVSFRVREGVVKILIVLERKDKADLEEIEDFATEFDALQENVNFEVETRITNEELQNPRDHVVVYRRREY